jgi:PncC family amidohydrolase
VFLGGTIAYTNFVKNRELGVSAELLRDRGAVNEEVARAMVEGACGRFGAEVGMSITGVAGPDGGTPETPVGTIWLAARVAGETRAAGKVFVGDREEIRLRASQAALDMVRRMLTRQIT